MCGHAVTVISRPKRSISAFVVEEGARAYIERINIRGNTRTRDYVIRREFDLGEGDAYNRALIDRAERRLKNLNYFKTVKITNEPGSAPDRVVINVDVEEQPTGEFSVSGGYSTADGLIGEVSVADRNLMGRGNYAKASRDLWSACSRLRPVVRRALSVRLSDGWRYRPVCPAKLASSYVSYDSQSVGANLRLGFALTEEIAFQPRYSFYQQKITLPISTITVNFQPDALSQRWPGVSPANELIRQSGALPIPPMTVATVMPMVKPRSPSARNWPQAPSICRWLATRCRIIRSTTTSFRPVVSLPNSGRISPASAAMSISSARG